MLKSRLRLKNNLKTGWSAVPLGAAASLLVFALTAALTSLAVLNAENPSEHIGLASLAVILISAPISGYSLSRYLGKDGFLRAVTSLLLTALLFIVIGAFSGGITPACLMNAASYLGIGAASAFLGRPRAKRHGKLR
jgi:hypothetical protein